MFADALVADVGAGGIVRDCVVRVEVGDVFPHTFVDVVAVLALQPLERAHVLGGDDLRLEGVEAFVDRG